MSIVSARIDPGWAWGKPTFYYNHSLSGLVATFEDTDHVIGNILNRLETDYWISTSTAGLNDTTFDAGAGNTYTADYFAVNGHNFNNVGATVSLQYSNTLDLSVPANAGTLAARVSPVPSFDDLPLLREFTSISARYWRLRVSQTVVVGTKYPKMVNAFWGEKTELDFASSSFDPGENTENALLISLLKMLNQNFMTRLKVGLTL